MRPRGGSAACDREERGCNDRSGGRILWVLGCVLKSDPWSPTHLLAAVEPETRDSQERPAAAAAVVVVVVLVVVVVKTLAFVV